MGRDLRGKELGPGLEQRKDGRYCARFTDKSGKRRSVYADSFRGVCQALERAKTKEVLSDGKIDTKITLEEWYEEWLNTYKKGNIRESSVKSNNTCYRMIASEAIVSRPLYSITARDVKELLIEVAGRGCAKATVDKVKAILHDIFQKACDEEIIAKNPVKGIKLNIGRTTEKKRGLTVEEQEKFFKAARDTPYYYLYIVAVNTGMRIGELIGLRESDIDFENNVIHVRRTALCNVPPDESGAPKCGPPKTKTSKRDIPMNSIAADALRGSLALPREHAAEEDVCVFVGRWGNPCNYRAIHRAVNKCADIAGIQRISPHILRHTFATRCLEANMKPKVLQEILGHSNIGITLDTYVHVTDNLREQEMEKFNNLMQQTMM